MPPNVPAAVAEWQLKVDVLASFDGDMQKTTCPVWILAMM